MPARKRNMASNAKRVYSIRRSLWVQRPLTYGDLLKMIRLLRDRLKNVGTERPSIVALSKLDVRIRIITHRLFIKYFHLTAVQQTVEWLETHDIPYWDLCFMSDKAAVGADLYIEDNPENVERLRTDGHPTIVFSNTTNLHLGGPRADTWAQVEALVVKELQKWKAHHGDEGELPGR